MVQVMQKNDPFSTENIDLIVKDFDARWFVRAGGKPSSFQTLLVLSLPLTVHTSLSKVTMAALPSLKKDTSSTLAFRFQGFGNGKVKISVTKALVSGEI